MAWSRLRQKLRQLGLNGLRRVLSSTAGERVLTDSLPGLLSHPAEVNAASWLQASQEYPDVASVAAPRREVRRESPIFITARFRSGSTLLWNLFRNVPGCTAFYEPLNERRWFDPRTRGTRVDASHLQVNDYWREYEGLEHLSQYFRADWNDRRLYMDSHAADPQLLAYLRALIDHAPGRAVLQFNRVDFRLPWLKRHFPDAKLIHLSRHPRDSWSSTLMSKKPCPREISIAQFANFDELYLLHWMNDLQSQFPLLRDPALRHPYQVYYCLWKLSYAFGLTHADYHLTYESLVGDPESQITEMFAELEMPAVQVAELARLVQPARAGRWREYADDAWFLEQEANCERLFNDYYATSCQRPVSKATSVTY